jgi:hypothetical protein
LLLSAAFASVAMFAAHPPPEGWLRLAASVCFVTLLTLGQMLLVPSAKDLIPGLPRSPRLARTTAHSPPPEALRYWREICCLAACWIARWCPQRRRFPLAAAGPLPALQRAGPERDLPPAQKLNRSLFRTILFRQFRYRAAVINQMADGQNGVTP